MSIDAAFRSSGYTFSIAGDPGLVQIVTNLLNSLPKCVDTATHRWVFSSLDDRCGLTIDGTLAFANVDRAGFTSYVVSTLTRQVLDAEPESMHLHAMAVVANGSALVAAGPSGAGKSTLCTALLRRGAEYMTDEAVAVDPSGLTISAFPKPIVVKRPGIANVARIIDTEPPSDAQAAWAILPSSIGSIASAMPRHARTIVAYRRTTEGGPARVRPIHRAALAHRLLTDSPDVERFGSASLGLIARLVASAHCLEASGDDATETADVLLQHHGAPYTPGIVEELAEATSGGNPMRVPGILSVIIDGRALTMDPTVGQLAELDEQTTAWWRLLDGTPIDALIAEITATTEQPEHVVAEIGHGMVAALQSANLVQSS